MCRDVKIVYFENRLSLQKSGFFYYLDWTVRQLIFNIIGSRVREHRRSMAPCTCIALTYRQIQKVVSILGNCAVINDGRRMLKSAVIGQQHLQCMNDASIMSWRLKWCRPCLLSGDDHVSRWRVLEAETSPTPYNDWHQQPTCRRMPCRPICQPSRRPRLPIPSTWNYTPSMYLPTFVSHTPQTASALQCYLLCN